MQPISDSQLEASRAQYDEHKRAFEQWTMDNNQQAGTPSYEQYVSDFRNWEAEMLKTIKRLEVQRVDAQLDEATKQQFYLALSKMSAVDKTFSSNLMNNYRRIMTTPIDSKAVRPTAPPQVVQMAAVSHPQYAHNMPGVTWKPAAPVKFRVPSPISSYKNPNSKMPFADFSK